MEKESIYKFAMQGRGNLMHIEHDLDLNGCIFTQTSLQSTSGIVKSKILLR